jgi:hypothetical protein
MMSITKVRELADYCGIDFDSVGAPTQIYLVDLQVFAGAVEFNTEARIIRETKEKLKSISLTPDEMDEIVMDAISPTDAMLQTLEKLKEKNT